MASLSVYPTRLGMVTVRSTGPALMVTMTVEPSASGSPGAGSVEMT